MIDRTWLPRSPTMTRWPNWDTAPLRTICAPLSALLQSPRGNHALGKGFAMGHATVAARVRLAETKRRAAPRAGKRA